MRRPRRSGTRSHSEFNDRLQRNTVPHLDRATQSDNHPQPNAPSHLDPATQPNSCPHTSTAQPGVDR